jgi:hypothetical protein
MGLINVGMYSTAAPGATEFSEQCSKREKKRVKKQKEGTEGIDATDERSTSDRFEDYKELTRDDD